MNDLYYEWHKLRGATYARRLILLLWLLGALLSFIQTGVYHTGVTRQRQITQEKVGFITYYVEHPDEVRAAMLELAEFDAEQSRLDALAHYTGEEYIREEWVDRYASDAVGDRQLFRMLQDALDKPASYRSAVEKVIRDAERNYNELRQMGVAANSSRCRYQLAVRKIYSARLADVRIGIEYSRGWGSYFQEQSTDLLILCALIVLASVIFPIERSRGMLPLLRSTRHGRGKTACSKMLLLLLSGVGITLAFSLTSFAVYAVTLGLSSPQNAIQSLSSFTLCQYPLSIGAYFAWHLIGKAITACAFCGALAVLSIAISHPSLQLLTHVAVLGSQIGMHLYASSHLLLQYNALSAMALSTSRRYYGISLFGRTCDALPIFSVGTLLLSIILAILAVLLFSHASASPRSRSIQASSAQRWHAHLSAFFRRKKTHRASRYPLSLFIVEQYKALAASRLLLPALALLLFGLAFVLSPYYRDSLSAEEAAYREYTTRWEGVVSEQVCTEIAEERTRINQALDAYQPAKSAYRQGLISADVYSKISRAYFDADLKDEVLQTVEQEVARLQRLSARGGADGWLLHTTGIEQLFSVGDSMLLYALILLLLIGTYSAEFSSTQGQQSSFSAILFTTKRGRDATLLSKIAVALFLSTMIYLLVAGVEAAAIIQLHDLPDVWHAPMVSLATYDSAANTLTLGEGLALVLALRGIGYGLLAMLTVALSALLHRVLSTAAAVLLLTCMPHLLARLGIGAAHTISFVHLTTVSELLSTLCSQDGAPNRIWVVYVAVLLLCGGASLLAWVKLRSRR